MQRDLQIDFVRGAGILMIAVDHLGYLAERFVPSDLYGDRKSVV